MKIILASSSPRRRDLLQRMGLHFDVVPSDFDESTLRPGGFDSLGSYVKALARKKAEYIDNNGESLIIAADTIVVLGGMILGKPSNEEEAREMLRKLSGRMHEVYTGICVHSAKGLDTEYDVTSVRFKTLDPARIDEYIASGGPLDKAGSYGIQEPIVSEYFIDRIEGSYNNVVGLPTEKLIPMLRKYGVNVKIAESD